MRMYTHKDPLGAKVDFDYRGGGLMDVTITKDGSTTPVEGMHLAGIAETLAEYAGFKVSREGDDSPEVQAAKIIAAAIRESSGTDAGLRARALTAERERDKALKERDEARRQHHAACEQRDAAHERADRLQRDFDAAVALSEQRQTLLEDGVRLDRDATYKAVEDGVMDAWRRGRRLPRDFYKAIMDRLDGVLPMTEQPDTRPTRSDLEAVAVSRLEDFYVPYAADEARVIVARMVADFPDLVRPGDPAPTEQDDTPDPWAPGTDITDRIKRGEFPSDGTWIVDTVPGQRTYFHRKDFDDMWRGQYGGSLFTIDLTEPGRTITVATPEELAAAGIKVAE